MHSANRAKQRLLRSSSGNQNSVKMGENLGGGKSPRPHVDFGTRRSKSLDRKTTLRKVKDIRGAYSPKGKNDQLIYTEEFPIFAHNLVLIFFSCSTFYIVVACNVCSEKK